MRRLVLALSLIGVMSIGGGVGWSQVPVARAATAPNATCTGGTLPPGTYNNVTVPTGASCGLDPSDIILGNLAAQAGSTLDVFGTSIGGNLQDQYGVFLDVAFATIGRNLQVGYVTGGAGVVDTTVKGNGQFSNNTADLLIGSNSFGGNLQVNNNTGGTDVVFNHIGNDLNCENNQPPPTSLFNTAEHYDGQCLS